MSAAAPAVTEERPAPPAPSARIPKPLDQSVLNDVRVPVLGVSVSHSKRVLVLLAVLLVTQPSATWKPLAYVALMGAFAYLMHLTGSLYHNMSDQDIKSKKHLKAGIIFLTVVFLGMPSFQLKFLVYGALAAAYLYVSGLHAIAEAIKQDVQDSIAEATSRANVTAQAMAPTDAAAAPPPAAKAKAKKAPHIM